MQWTGPVGSASGERAVEHDPAQQRVHRLRRFHVDHLPDARDRDYARVGDPLGQNVGHLLTKDANAATVRQIAELAPGSTLAMTFLLPTVLVDDADRTGPRMAANGA